MYTYNMKLNVCHLSPINILKTVTESFKKKKKKMVVGIAKSPFIHAP